MIIGLLSFQAEPNLNQPFSHYHSRIDIFWKLVINQATKVEICKNLPGRLIQRLEQPEQRPLICEERPHDLVLHFHSCFALTILCICVDLEITSSIYQLSLLPFQSIVIVHLQLQYTVVLQNVRPLSIFPGNKAVSTLWKSGSKHVFVAQHTYSWTCLDSDINKAQVNGWP